MWKTPIFTLWPFILQDFEGTIRQVSWGELPRSGAGLQGEAQTRNPCKRRKVFRRKETQNYQSTRNTALSSRHYYISRYLNINKTLHSTIFGKPRFMFFELSAWISSFSSRFHRGFFLISMTKWGSSGKKIKKLETAGVKWKLRTIFGSIWPEILEYRGLVDLHWS